MNEVLGDQNFFYRLRVTKANFNVCLNLKYMFESQKNIWKNIPILCDNNCEFAQPKFKEIFWWKFMERVLKKKVRFSPANISRIKYLNFDFFEYSMSMEKLGNNLSIHKGQAPFHTMGKDQECFSFDDKTKDVLLNINREFDGVEDDLIFYERWLVNCDRDNKKRRHIFR